MDLGLKGKTAMILGASGGMGSQIARHLAAEGARLVLTARNSKSIERQAKEFGALITVCDITCEDQLQSLMDEDIAEAALWLTSDKCFMIGENLQVSGGLTLRRNPNRQVFMTAMGNPYPTQDKTG